MATNDFLPFATGAGANVMSQADWQALAQRLSGFQSGVAQSAQLNKAWRQASIMAAVLAQFIVDRTGQDALDDGTIATLLAGLKNSAAQLNGDSSKTFSVAAGTQSQHAVQLGQMNQLAYRKRMQVYTAGVNSFTVPDGVYRIRGRCWGAGASGGGSGGSSASGGGGGAGGYAEGYFDVTPGQVIVCTVGAGGASGGPGANGNNGGTSSIGSIMSATGGSFGAGVSSGIGTGGFGGAGVGGQLAVAGMGGANAYQLSASALLSGGGGAAYSGRQAFQVGLGNGYPGIEPGGGGSGGSSGSYSGGAGSNGMIILEW